MIGGLSLVGDVLVPLGAILTVVTAVGTVHWLKGKRRLALLAPLSVVSVFGIVGTTRVAKPDSPWARWRYDDDRMSQACARFGGAPPDRPERSEPSGAANAAFGLVVVGVVAGVPFGAVTSLVGGVLLGYIWLARSGRVTSRRVCGWARRRSGGRRARTPGCDASRHVRTSGPGHDSSRRDSRPDPAHRPGPLTHSPRADPAFAR